MFTKNEEKELLNKYNKYYNTYFPKCDEYMDYTKLCKNIYNYYNNNSKELNYKKKKLKNKINTLSNDDSSNHSITFISIAFTFFITYITLVYTLNIQAYYTNHSSILNNNHKILENSTELKLLEIDLKKEQDTNLKEKLNEKKQGLIKENKLLEEENKSFFTLNETSGETINNITDTSKKNLLFYFFVYIAFVIIMNYVFKSISDKNYNKKKSFLLLCLEILEDVEKEENREKFIKEVKQYADSNNVIKNGILPTVVGIVVITMLNKFKKK